MSTMIAPGSVLLSQLSGDTETNPGPITVSDLEKELKDLVDWKGFGVHLPGISQSDLDEISWRVCPLFKVKKQKSELYKKWLKKHEDASWDDVAKALTEIGEFTLADKVSSLGNPDERDEMTIYEANNSANPQYDYRGNGRRGRAKYSLLKPTRKVKTCCGKAKSCSRCIKAAVGVLIVAIVAAIIAGVATHLGNSKRSVKQGNMTTNDSKVEDLQTTLTSVSLPSTTLHVLHPSTALPHPSTVVPDQSNIVPHSSTAISDTSINSSVIQNQSTVTVNNSNNHGEKVDSVQEVMATLLGVEQLTTGCKSRQLNPSISNEPRTPPPDGLYKMDRVTYHDEHYWKGLSIRWKSTATDERTGTKVTSSDWKTRSGAREHAYKELMEQLKAEEQKRHSDREKLIGENQAKVESIVKLLKYKSARGIMFSVEMSDSCRGVMLNKQSIEEKLGFAIYTITDPTSDDMSLLVEAAACIQYPSQYEYIVFHYSGQGGVNELNQLFVKPFIKKTENEQILMDRDIIVPLKDVATLTRLFLFNCCTSLCDHNSMSTANAATGKELIVFTMARNQTLITNPYCYVCE